MPDVVRWIVALVIFAHGVGHVLFMPSLFAAMHLQASGHSWLLTNVLGESSARLVGTIAAAVALAGFVAVGGGIVAQTGWWRPLAIVSATLSIALIVLFVDGFQTSGALSAMAFDALVLVALLAVRWPSPELIGS